MKKKTQRPAPVRPEKPVKRPKLSADTLRKAMLRRVSRRTRAKGTLDVPAVPSLVDHYVEELGQIFAALGRPFSAADLAGMRKILLEKIQWAWERSHNAWVAVEWSTDPSPKMSLSYTMTGWHRTVAEKYAEWVAERDGSLFGTRADARLVDLAKTLGDPRDVSILDVGAGTGRNAFELARAGYPVDALEIAPALAEKLASAGGEEELPIQVMLGDFFALDLALPRPAYRIVVLAETCSHWRGFKDLRAVFERLALLVEPGGVGLFSAFVAHDDFEPDAATREFSQIVWCPVFTRAELAKAAKGLPLELLSDDSVHDYEKAHLPAEAWPPTNWYESWTKGRDLYELAPEATPMELRWLAYRRV